MDTALVLKGLAIGLAIAAPVGPIGVLCIRRTLTEGRAAGLASGLGAATADAIYAGIAGFGLTFLSDALVAQRAWPRLLSGVVLCGLGLRTIQTKPPGETPRRRGRSLAGAYASTAVLTLANPMTILAFAAAFAGLGLAGPHGDPGSAAALVLGVFGGSAAWWLALSSGIGALRRKVAPRGLPWVNRVSGAVILGFGIASLVSGTLGG